MPYLIFFLPRLHIKYLFNTPKASLYGQATSFGGKATIPQSGIRAGHGRNLPVPNRNSAK